MIFKVFKSTFTICNYFSLINSAVIYLNKIFPSPLELNLIKIDPFVLKTKMKRWKVIDEITTTTTTDNRPILIRTNFVNLQFMLTKFVFINFVFINCYYASESKISLFAYLSFCIFAETPKRKLQWLLKRFLQRFHPL